MIDKLLVFKFRLKIDTMRIISDGKGKLAEREKSMFCLQICGKVVWFATKRVGKVYSYAGHRGIPPDPSSTVGSVRKSRKLRSMYIQRWPAMALADCALIASLMALRMSSWVSSPPSSSLRPLKPASASSKLSSNSVKSRV